MLQNTSKALLGLGLVALLCGAGSILQLLGAVCSHRLLSLCLLSFLTPELGWDTAGFSCEVAGVAHNCHVPAMAGACVSFLWRSLPVSSQTGHPGASHVFFSFALEQRQQFSLAALASQVFS